MPPFICQVNKRVYSNASSYMALANLRLPMRRRGVRYLRGKGAKARKPDESKRASDVAA
jgi:hypothetical protein